MPVKCVRCNPPETDSCEAMEAKCAAHNQVVKAKDLVAGDFFRKVTGQQVYLVISESSLNFYKFDLGFVYGVSRCGNMCDVKLDKDVVIVDGTGWGW